MRTKRVFKIFWPFLQSLNEANNNIFLEGGSPTLMTPTDSTNNQNIVTIERANIPSHMIFPSVM